jgi:hypothetical protein
MNADVKDTHLIDTQASELLGKLLNGDMDRSFSKLIQSMENKDLNRQRNLRFL